MKPCTSKIVFGNSILDIQGTPKYAKRYVWWIFWSNQRENPRMQIKKKPQVKELETWASLE